VYIYMDRLQSLLQGARSRHASAPAPAPAHSD
jgi:hypothetical protein